MTKEATRAIAHELLNRGTELGFDIGAEAAYKLADAVTAIGASYPAPLRFTITLHPALPDAPEHPFIALNLVEGDAAPQLLAGWSLPYGIAAITAWSWGVASLRSHVKSFHRS
jgi:hypothetical protein